MSESEKTAEQVLQDRLTAAQEKRTALTTSRDLAALERLVTDEEALAALELAYPDGFAVVFLNAPVGGCPGFVAARDCTPPEFKRYQAGIKVRMVNKAAEVEGGADGSAQMARTCLISPDAQMFAKMSAARPGLESGLGQEVVARAQTRKADDSKK